MTAPAFDVVVLGLSLSSSWGNGHASTWRALIRGLDKHGKRVLFLERDVPWYAAHRDLANPDYCELAFYNGVGELIARYGDPIGDADTVIVGSYVPEGKDVIDLVFSRARGKIAYYDIDTPVTLAALDRGEENYLAPSQIPEFDVYLSFSGGPALDHVQRRFGARRAFAFYCCVDEVVYKPMDAEPRWDLGFLGTYSADRQAAVERLLIEPARQLPDKRFVVAGPQYPDDVAWPPNVTRIVHLPPAKHPIFYARQNFTLNVTRSQMVAAGWSPSVRLFEAAACGTPIISDQWPGLTELFPEGDAVVVARSARDVIEVLTSFEPARRRRVAEKSRRRVLAHHTGQARARELLAILSSTRARKRNNSLRQPSGPNVRPACDERALPSVKRQGTHDVEGQRR
jgi:spore maturation protein CgeB